MATRSVPKIAFDARLMAEDMAAQGLTPQTLPDKANGKVSLRTVYRFLNGEVQSTRTALVLATALGFTPERYLIRSSASHALAS